MKIVLNVLNGSPEIYQSFQGEGRNYGEKCILIRLKGCNLRCSWCDTRDSWDYENSGNEGAVAKTIDEICDMIHKYKTKHLVITGGEPLLQQVELAELIRRLPDYYIEVETNGTIVPFLQVDQFNVSPKLSHSENSGYAENEEALSVFAELDNADFKFVISQKSDISEVLRFSADYNIPANRIFLMPLGTTTAELDVRDIMVRELAKKYGFSFTDRLHVRLYENRRGV